MEFSIRSSCSLFSLSSFVRLLCLFGLCLNLIASLVLIVLFALGDFLSLFLFALLLSLSFVGVFVNLLCFLGLFYRRPLCLLPWLVYHALLILGCCALGCYIALHYTVLSEHLTVGPHSSSRILAVVSIFPMMTAIFLIFLWIFVYQYFIQMKVKNLKDNSKTLAKQNDFSETLVFPERGKKKDKNTNSTSAKFKGLYSYSSDGKTFQDGPHIWVSSKSLLSSNTSGSNEFSREFLDAYDEGAYLPPPEPTEESSIIIGDSDLSGLVPPPPLEEPGIEIEETSKENEIPFPPVLREENSSWFSKLTLNRSRSGYTKDQIIGLYCSDVPL